MVVCSEGLDYYYFIVVGVIVELGVDGVVVGVYV